VDSKIRLPRKKLSPCWMLSVPPAMTVKVPIAAIAIPNICAFVRCSLSSLTESVVMRMGETRHTSMAAIEAPAMLMPVYWAMKKNVTPVRARLIMVGMCSIFVRSL